MTEQEIRKTLADGTNMTTHDIEKHIREGLAIYEDTAEEFQDFKGNWVGGLNDPEEAREEWEKLDLIESNGKKYRVDFLVNQRGAET